MPEPILRRLCATLVVSLAGAAPLAAAVGGGDLVNDVRLSVGIAPGVDGPGSEDTDTGARIGISYFSSVLGDWRDWGGWIAGGEFSMSPSSGKDDAGNKVRALDSAFTAFFGAAHRLAANERLHFEATPFLGIGVSQVKLPDTTKDDTYWEIGVRVAGFWTFASGWQVGADIRLLSGQSVNNDYQNRGVVVSAVGGYHF